MIMSKKKLTPADYDRWETPPGAIFAIEPEDEKPEEKPVAKTYDEVRKFNPFHDSRGRFSSSQGFASYSANPKTKAGAMAIQRSYAAGHGRTLNVHRESKGESVTQNANWLSTGKKPAVPAAVSRARYQQRKLKQQAARQQAQQSQQTGQQQAQNSPKAQSPAAPKQTPAAQKPAQQAQQAQHQMAQGKNITRSFSMDHSSKKRAFDQVAEQQGFDKKPRVVDQKEFDAAVQKTGIIAYRTWDPATDTVTGKYVSAKGFKKQFMEDDSIQAAGNGGRAYGGGTYIATNSNPRSGTTPSLQAMSAAKRDSQSYGTTGRSVTATITLDPSAKVADYNTVWKSFKRLPNSTKYRYGHDVGAYAAAQGYDAMRAVGAGWGCDYVTIFNRTKAIVLKD